MGGGGSKPASQPAPRVAPPPVQKTVTEDPKPTAGNNTTGVSVSGAKECCVEPRTTKCIPCTLLVNPNISTSVVTLSRSMDEVAGPVQNRCPEGETNRLDRKTVKGGMKEFACEKNGVITYYRTIDPARIEAKNHCDDGWDESERTGLDGGRVKIRCLGPCPGGQRVNRGETTKCEDIDTTIRGFERINEQRGDRPYHNIILTPQKTEATAFAASKKLFIKPDKAFEVTVDGKTFTITQMAIYRPCPIRIENVQADAVLSLNDYSDPNAKVVILLPMSAAVTYGAPGDFVGRVMQNLDAFTVNETTGQFNPLVVPVGNDWSLTRVLEVGGGQNGEVSGGYFKWVAADYEKYVKSASFKHIHYSWRQKPGGVTTILMKNPIAVSYFTSAYLARLPYAPSAESAPPPSSIYEFKAGKCLTCSGPPTFDPAKIEEMKKGKGPSIDPVTVATTIIALVFGLVAFVAIYYALSFALRGYGRSLGGMSASFAEYLVIGRRPPAAPPA